MSPLKSQAQLRKIASLQADKKLKPGTFEEYLQATPSVKKLPERVKAKKRKKE